MQKIFDTYIENAFEDHSQAYFKILQFEHNYKNLFSSVSPDDKVLDIGVGRGEMLSCMKKWGFEYLGIDISPSTVAFCQSLGLNSTLVSSTQDFLKQNLARFKVITCLDVLEHVPREQVVEFLSSIREALTSDGLLILQVPNLQSPFGYLHHFNDITHVNGFVEHSLRQVLMTSGFSSYAFGSFEEVIGSGIKLYIFRSVQRLFRRFIRFLRWLNSNPNPRILSPVIFVVAYPTSFHIPD